jgi:CheY-like chemotaxis protein
VQNLHVRGGQLSEILLAEDNPADVYLVREALKEHGVTSAVRVAADGREVLKIISAEDHWRPDLIILDLNLPRHDGLEILEKLKSAGISGNVPTVVLTSSDSPGDRRTANDLGVTRYLRKPSNLEQFLQLGAVFKELLTNPPASTRPAVVSEESVHEG